MITGVMPETVGLLEKIAAFSERRHEVLAGNLANIDTPNYKTRDLDVDGFQQALKQAAAVQHQSAYPSLGMEMSQPPSLSQIFSQELFQAREIEPANITFQDGNNRSVEREVMELTKNNLMQSFAVQLIAAQASLMQSVISERV